MADILTSVMTAGLICIGSPDSGYACFGAAQVSHDTAPAMQMVLLECAHPAALAQLVNVPDCSPAKKPAKDR